ncbi:hypothetical protein TNIN_325141 [Trichonephila inaurata madagascariensis]|uniref:Uncharacterized protein n=1 Tax=Trichonephila inaurata madagascariensis TaxID=2747483 RepID=A0A8X6XL58_9ARAC|nr:hypothetical protein TNIN_325141 [Trichonephila inaurata madagascariensis]
MCSPLYAIKHPESVEPSVGVNWIQGDVYVADALLTSQTSPRCFGSTNRKRSCGPPLAAYRQFPTPPSTALVVRCNYYEQRGKRMARY